MEIIFLYLIKKYGLVHVLLHALKSGITNKSKDLLRLNVFHLFHHYWDHHILLANNYLVYLIIQASTKDNVFGGGVPVYVAHAATVTMEVHLPLGEVRQQTTPRYLPDLHLETYSTNIDDKIFPYNNLN